MLPEWDAIFDDRTFAVFGQNLPPLSLGGLFLLQQIDSPLVSPGRPATADDVLLAVYLCARQHEEARRALRSPDLVAEWAQWGIQWGRQIGHDIAARAAAIEAECARFRDYLARWIRAPRRWRKSESAAGTKTPWVIFLVSELRRHYGMTDAEAWALHCSKAFAYYAAICEGHGDKDLMTPTEAAQVDAITAAAKAGAT